MATQNQTIIDLNEKLTAAQARIADLETSCGHCGEFDKLGDRLAAAERERDEWMEKCEAARSYSNTLIGAKNRMMRERDEAKESAIPSLVVENVRAQFAFDLATAERERDEARTRIAELERYGREQIEHREANRRRAERAEHLLAAAERERDEALETLKMVREIGLADEDGAATVESVIERVLSTSPCRSPL